MKKKLLSILLSLAMVVTMMPMATMTAFAATAGSGTKSDPWLIGTSTANDVTAYLDGTTLHIEGSGAMMDFRQSGSPSEAPWVNDGENNINTVVIGSGVTCIGRLAFTTCSHLTSVEMPSVMSIGESAFYDCKGLTSVDMLSVTSIGDHAFSDCKGLTSVDMPSVTSIMSYAFNNCSNLTSVDIGSTFRDGSSGSSLGLTFTNCGKLNSVVIRTETPPKMSSAFENCNALTEIIVPAASETAYKESNWWSDYKNIIKGAYYVNVAAAANGTVTASPAYVAAADYVADSKTITLTVTPDEGYQLKEGTLKVNDGAITLTGNTFQMPAANVTVTAEFEEITTYGIISEVQGHGSVTTKIGDADVTEAAEGAEVVFTATADEGYQFKEWVDVRGNASLSSTTTNQITITMPAAEIKIKAVFEAIPPVGDTVTVQTNGHGTATATNVGGTVTLTPAPESGYGLKEWQVISGDLDANDIVNNQFTMPSGNVTIKAIFAPLYTVTAEVDGHGASAEASVASAVEGTKVTLTATAQEGYELDHWEVVSGGVTVSDDEGYYFTMPAANVKVKAIFKAIEPGSYGIITEAQGHGNVTATVGGETVTSAAKDASVILTAVAEEGYQFKEWVDVRGNASLSSTTTNPITITMPAAEIKVKAVFEEKIDEGNKVTIIGGKHGSVVVSTDGKPITSDNKVPEGTKVTVKAKPHFGYYLKKLTVKDSDNITVPVTKNTFTMPDKDVTITATFSPVVIPIPIIDPTPGQSDQEKFESYKLAQKTECDKLITITDSEAVKTLVADAKTAIDNIKFDSKKSLNENKAVVDSIVAELKVNIETVRADEATTALVKAAKVNLTKIATYKNGKVKLTFKSLKLENGVKIVNYQVYRSTSKKFDKNLKKYSIKRTTDAKNYTWTNAKKLKKGTKYYYKVRGKVQLSDGTYVYTKWSNVKNTKCKKTIK